MERRWPDLIRAHNDFYKFILTNPLTPRAGYLYWFIVSLFNRAFWPEWAEISLDTLAGGCNMSKDSVKRGRKELSEKGLIEVCPQGANRHAKYRLIEPSFWGGRMNEAEVKAARDFLRGAG